MLETPEVRTLLLRGALDLNLGREATGKACPGDRVCNGAGRPDVVILEHHHIREIHAMRVGAPHEQRVPEPSPIYNGHGMSMVRTRATMVTACPWCAPGPGHARPAKGARKGHARVGGGRETKRVKGRRGSLTSRRCRNRAWSFVCLRRAPPNRAHARGSSPCARRLPPPTLVTGC